jgi:hypothetical protein
MNKHSDKPPPKAGQVVDHRADLLNWRAALKTELTVFALSFREKKNKTELPHLIGGGSDQTAAAEG